MSDFRNFLRLNVGFITRETVGYTRDFPLDLPSIQLTPDLKIKDLKGRARVTRTTQGLLLQVKACGYTTAECVRCLDPFDLFLDSEFTDLYAFNPNSVTETGLTLPENSIIDLQPILRDEMQLAVPINPICRPDCKGLCPYCGENQNQILCNHQDEDIDPRLDTLKSLLGKG